MVSRTGWRVCCRWRRRSSHPRLSLGYREVALAGDGVLGRSGTRFRGHEFHFASVLSQSPAKALFRTFNAEMEPLGDAGMRVGSVMGSFVHLMDRRGGGTSGNLEA